MDVSSSLSLSALLIFLKIVHVYSGVCVFYLCCFKSKTSLSKMILLLLFLVCKSEHQHPNVLLTSYTVEDCAHLTIAIFHLVLLFVEKNCVRNGWNDRILNVGMVLASCMSQPSGTEHGVMWGFSRYSAGFAVLWCFKSSLLPFSLLEELLILKSREKCMKRM